MAVRIGFAFSPTAGRANSCEGVTGVVKLAREPIAVIGMSCRYPGGIDSPERFWQLLVQGRDVIREGPHGRWDVDAFYDPDVDVPGRCTSRWAGYFDDITGFDAGLLRHLAARGHHHGPAAPADDRAGLGGAGTGRPAADAAWPAAAPACSPACATPSTSAAWPAGTRTSTPT